MVALTSRWHKPWLLKLGSALLLACLLTSASVSAQFNYQVSTFSGTYAPLSIGTGASTAGTVGDGVFTSGLSIGFSFNYNGTSYSTFGTSTDGFISFTAVANSATNNNLVNSAAPNAALAPWWDDQNTAAVGSNPAGSILYQTTGSAGNRVLTVQWTNSAFATTTNGQPKRINYQIKLHETTNVIEFWYGDATGSTFNTSESATIGIKSQSGGSGQFICAVTGSKQLANGMMTTNKWPAQHFRFTPGATTPVPGGTYSVGSGGTYPNLNAAFRDINLRGVGGALTLDLTDALYDTTSAGGRHVFPLVLGPVSGTSVTNRLMITRSGSPAELISRGSAAGNVPTTALSGMLGILSEPVIGLIGTDYTTLNNLSLKGVNSSTGDKIDLGLYLGNYTAADGATNNIASNLSITLDRTNVNTVALLQTIQAPPSSPTGANSNNTFKNLTIRNTNRGILLNGNASIPDLNSQITTEGCTERNRVGDSTSYNGDIGLTTSIPYGIQLSHQSGFLLENCDVSNVVNLSGPVSGINILSFKGVCTVRNNRVRNASNNDQNSTGLATGIQASHTTTGSHSLRIYNNTIAYINGGFNGPPSFNRGAVGLYLNGTGGTNAQSYEVRNNTISINGYLSPWLASTCIEMVNTAGPLFLISDNILANTTFDPNPGTAHTAVWSSSATSLGASGSFLMKNDIHVPWADGSAVFAARCGASNYDNVGALEATMLQASANLEVNPMLVDLAFDLRAFAGELNGAGSPLPTYLTHDLVCAPRVDSDIGAFVVNESGPMPSNNECAGAQPLVLTALSDCPLNAVTGTTDGATISAGLAICSPDWADVWYSVTGDSSGTSTISVVPGSAAGINMESFYDCATFANACSVGATATLAVPDGDLRYVKVSTQVPGTFTICASPGPSNNDCAHATQLPFTGYCNGSGFVGTTIGASSIGDGGNSLADVWYEVIGGPSGSATVEVCPGTATILELFVYSEGCEDENIVGGAAGSTVDFVLPSGESRLIRVVTDTPGTFSISAYSETYVTQAYANANKNWALSGSPYILAENITISDSLIIQPGVQVHFPYQRTLAISGKLKALGTATDSVRFIGTDPAAGNYGGGLIFNSGSNASVFNYCRFDRLGETTGLTNDALVAMLSGASNLTLNRCTFKNSEFRGLYVPSLVSGLQATNCTFSNNANESADVNVRSVAGFQGNTLPRIRITGNVDVGDALLPTGAILGGSKYYRTTSLTVSSSRTLTIQPGVEVQLGNNVSITSSGNIQAIGSVTDTIVFIGVDPSPSNYGGGITLQSNSTGSSFRFCKFQKMGETAGGVSAPLKFTGGDNVYVERSRIVNAEAYGIWLPSTALASDNVVIDSCRIEQCGNRGLYWELPTSGLQVSRSVFSNNGSENADIHIRSVSGFQNNTLPRIAITGTVDANTTLPGGAMTDGSRFYSSGISINTGTTLSVQSGVEVQFGWQAGISCNGAILANGTQTDSITFIGVDPTAGKYGGGIILQSSSAVSSFRFCKFQKMGETTSGVSAPLKFTGGDNVSIERSRIVNAEAYGIWLPSTSLASDNVVIDSCRIEQCGNRGLYWELPTIGLQVSRTVFSNNGSENADVHIRSVGGFQNNTLPRIAITGTVDANTTLPGGAMTDGSRFYSSGISINTGTTLSVQPGVEVQLAWQAGISCNGAILANGTQADSITFIGVDPATSNYGGGITLQSSSTGSSFRFCKFQKMGETAGGVSAPLKFQGGDHVNVERSRIVNAEAYGIWLPSTALASDSVVIDSCRIEQCGNRGLYWELPTAGLQVNYSTFLNNGSSNDIWIDINTAGGFLANQASLINLTGSVSSFGLLPGDALVGRSRYTTGFTVPATTTLTIEGGAEVQFTGLETITFAGRLIAQGTPTDSVIFRGISTNVNTHGGGVIFNSTSQNNILQFVRFQHLGDASASPNACMYVNGGTVSTLTDCSFIDSENYGLRTNNSAVSMTRCEFKDNASYGCYVNGTGNVDITSSAFSNNINGLRKGSTSTGAVSVTGSNFALTNTTYGAYNETTQNISALNNWWGHASGPQHPTLNPGGLGTVVSNFVLFNPYSTVPLSLITNDLKVVALTQPVSECNLGASETVAVDLYNNGNDTVEVYTIGLVLNGDTLFSETITNALLLFDDSLHYVFPITLDLSQPQAYDLQVFVAPETDDNLFNNAVNVTVNKFGTINSAAQFTGRVPYDGTGNLQAPINFTWDPVQYANKYDLYLWRATDPVPTNPTVNDHPGINLTYNTALDYATPYRWKLVAQNQCPASRQSDTLGFVTAFRPDLVVQSVQVPVAPFSGQQIQISWVVRNQGANSTGNYTWTDRAYLSTDNILDQLDTYLGGQSNALTLAPNETYSNTITANLDPVAFGSYYVLVKTDHSNSANESNETNNVTAQAMVISQTPPADLEVTNLVGPANAISELSYGVTWTVTNTGTGPATANTWLDRVYISSQSIFNVNQAWVLASVYHTDTLPSDSSYTVSTNITIPQGYNGTYYFFVRTDVQNYQFEFTGENNNTSAAFPVQVILQPPPDLSAQVVSFNPTAVSDLGSVQVQYSVTNVGASFSNESLTDRVYVGTNSVFQNGTTYHIGTATGTHSLANGASYSQLVNCTVPANVTGPFYVFVSADHANDLYEFTFEANNVNGLNGLTVHHADLSMGAITAPSTVLSGQGLTVSYAVQNSGLGDVLGVSRQDRLYLNTTATLAGATQVGTASFADNHTAGTTKNRSASITIPQGLSGSFHLLVQTDGGSAVFENGSEANNTASDPIQVNLASHADLAVTALSGIPANILSGAVLNAVYTVQNQGAASVSGQSWTDRVYLSTSPTWQQNMPLTEVQAFTVSELLAPGASYTRNISFTMPLLPANQWTGTRYLYVLADQQDVVYEFTSTANNIASNAAIAVASPAPVNLRVTSAQLNTTTVTPGTPYPLNWSVQNTGASTAVWGTSSWSDGIFLSADSLWSTSDPLVGTTSISGTLDSLATYSSSATVLMPYGIAGQFYLLLVADHLSNTNDTSRTNNVRVILLNGQTPGGGGTITLPTLAYPDFDITSVNVPGQGTAGQPLSVSWSVANIGDSVALVGPVLDRVYLSTNLTISDDDVLLASVAAAPIGPGASYSRTQPLTLPIAAVGNYFVLIKTDALDVEYEDGSETNNLVSAVVQVVQSPPGDLIVTDVLVPSSALVGQTITFDYRIANTGTNPIAGAMHEVIFLSTDPVWSVDDAVFGERDLNVDLSPGEAQWNTLTGPLPGIPQSTYYAIVQTDALNNFIESNENNNRGTSLGTLELGMPLLQLDVVEAFSLPDAAERYYRIHIPDSLNGETMLVSLTTTDATSVNELYASQGSTPTRSTHDFSSTEPNTLVQEVIVPDMVAGDYYVLAYGVSADFASQGVQVLATILPFEVRSVNADEGGNTGNCTVEIEGARFTTSTSFALAGPGGTIPSSSIYFVNSSRVFATFPLAGATPGTYDVQATDPATENDVLSDAYTVVQGTPVGGGFGGPGSSGSGGGGGGNFNCYITSNGSAQYLNTIYDRPSAVFITGLAPITVQWSYEGNVDIVTPSRMILSLSGVPIALNLTGLSEDKREVVLEFSEPDGPPGILRPGATGTIGLVTQACNCRKTLQFLIMD